jgi:protein tyrosine kinase modulator
VLPGKQYTPEDLLTIVRRRWLVIGVPFVLVVLAAAAVSLSLPKRYRSETVILVIPQRVPESYVRSTVSARIEDRLLSISQQILSRTRLERVIQDFNLYQEERRQSLMEDVVARMRNAIWVEVVKGDSFRVSYTGDDPATVQKVTNRLAALFIGENLRDREMLAEGTNQFLQAQLDDARRRLLDNEQKLENYKRTYAGELPTQVGSNLQAMQNVQMQVQALIESLNRDRDRKSAVERTIADLNLPGDRPGPAPVASTPQLTDVSVGGSIAEQLAAAQASLQALELRLTGEHPDVARMRRQVAELRQRAADTKSGPSLSLEAVETTTPSELAKLNRLQELQTERRNLEEQIVAKTAEERRLRDLTSALQVRIDAVPTREAELTELTRDYATLQNIYNTLLVKREDSKISANLERRQVGEQFKLIDPAGMPEKPVSPNLLRLNLLGAILGLGLGVGLTALLEYRDTSFRTEHDVVGVFALPVLAQIPVMTTAVEAKRRRRRRVAFGVVVAVMVLCAGGGAVGWKLGMWELGILDGLHK